MESASTIKIFSTKNLVEIDIVEAHATLTDWAKKTRTYFETNKKPDPWNKGEFCWEFYTSNKFFTFKAPSDTSPCIIELNFQNPRELHITNIFENPDIYFVDKIQRDYIRIIYINAIIHLFKSLKLFKELTIIEPLAAKRDFLCQMGFSKLDPDYDSILHYSEKKEPFKFIFMR